MSMNKAIVMGRLGQDPELRYTQGGTAVTNLSIATTEYSKGEDGNRKEMTEWHKVQCWGKQAENCAKYLAKGRQVLVEGRLTTRSWEDQNGNKKYSTEIVASNVQFIGGSNDNESGQKDSQKKDAELEVPF